MRFRAVSPRFSESRRAQRASAQGETSHASGVLQSDKQLMEAAQRGDRIAFAAIIQRHQGAIYGYLRSRLLEPADAEDLCQEVFLRCYVSPARFDHSAMIRPWLIGIARNLLREHVRRIRRRREVGWTELCLELEEMVGLQDERYDEMIRHLPHCLESLGQSARQAIDFRYQAKLRLAEIGERLHRSEGAVKLLMFRARQALKHCLDAQTAQAVSRNEGVVQHSPMSGDRSGAV
jgi:RNA polymerase sigma-70 factor (ECF subfamily)